MKKIDTILHDEGLTSWQKDIVQHAGDSKTEAHKRFMTGHRAADVLIIGGGMAGMLAAYFLSKEGKSVIVLEKNMIGSGVTSHTTAFLTEVIDTDYKDLISVFGKETAKKIIGSHRHALGILQKISIEHDIDCDFRTCSNYIYANTEKQFEELKEEHASALELGVDALLIAGYSGLGFENKGHMEVRNQAKFHPLKFIFALRKLCENQGVKVYEHVEATDVLTIEAAHKKGLGLDHETGVIVMVEDEMLYASWAVVATYEPFDQPLRLYFKKGIYTSYVLEATVHGLQIEEGLYEDMDNPYHYFRIDNRDEKSGTSRMIIGGEDHRSDIHIDEERNFNALHEYLNKIIPSHAYDITNRWKGPILEPVDGLAAIGPLDDNGILYATGFSGTGMTYSAISAIVLTDYVMGRDNDLKEIYAAKRTPFLHSLAVKGRDYVEELVHGAASNFFGHSKHSITDRKDSV